MADTYDELFGGAPIQGAPTEPPGNYDSLFTDTTALDADADETRALALNRDDPISESDATRRAAHIAPAYYSLPRWARAWATTDPETQDKLKVLQRRASNVLERTGGALAYWASRPMQHTTWRGLEELHKRFPGGAEAFERLWRTMPEPGKEHEREAPSAALHEQLDDVAADSLEGTSWLDTEPQYMERMSKEVDAEKLYVVAKHGGDWESYQKELESLPLAQRLGRRARFLVEDLLAPDPLFLVNKPITALKAVGKGVKILDQALAARKIGEPLADVRGAVETIEAVHGPVGSLVKHIGNLERKLEGLGEGADDTVQFQRVSRRLVEAQAELAARKADAAEPVMRLYRPPQRHPQTIYRPLSEMDPDEVAKRYSAAESQASLGDVDAAVKAQGYSGTQDFIDRMDDAHKALVRGEATPNDMGHLAAYQRLPEAVQAHLDELGVSRQRVMEAAALERGEAVSLAGHADLSNPSVAAARAFLGPDDVEEAGAALAHARDGGNVEHLRLHAVQAPEHSVVGQGASAADGVFLRDVPDYRSINEDGIRRMSRRDAMTHLLGRQAIPGLGVGSTHVDAPSLVKAVHKIGRKAAFAGSRFLPLSVATFAPEVARTYDRAHMNYKLVVNEGQDYLRGAMRASGMFRITGDGTVKVGRGMRGQVDRVIDMLDTEVDPLTGTSPELEAQLATAPEQLVTLYKSLRSWFDAQAVRLGLDRGGSLSGYFPHYFPEADRASAVRQLEYLGVSPKAAVSFFALKHRTGAEGWSRDLVNTLDIYNRGAARKSVMEPAYQRILETADEYRAAGKLDEANFTEKFLADARGQGRSIFDFFADHMEIPQSTRGKIERTTRNVTALFYKALLGGNMNYALQNMAGGTSNMAALHGPFATLQGLLQFATPQGRDIARRSGVLKEALHSIEAMPQNTSKALEDAYKVMDVGQRTEAILRGVAVNTALSEQLTRSGKSWREVRAAGLDQAFIAEAAKLTDRSQHTFGPLGRSPYLHTLLGHTGYQATVQLGTYPYKQSEFLLRSAVEDPGFIVRYLAMSGIFARMAAEGDIAAGQSVGFGFAESVINPRKGRIIQYAPIIEGIASTVDLWEAWRSGDPSEIKLAREKWWTASEAMVPFLNQYERYARNIRESLAGKKEKFQDREPLSEVTKQLLAGAPEVFSAERGLEPDERLLHALGVRTVQDQIELGERGAKKKARQAKEAKRLEREQRVEEARRRRADAKRQRNAELRGYEASLDAYDKALRSGDAAAAHAIYEQGVQDGRMLFSDDQEQARREAAFLRARVRMLRRAPGFLPPSMGNR